MKKVYSSHQLEEFSKVLFYTFWASKTKLYKKRTFWSLLPFHSDSLNVNDTEFTFNGLTKLNTERPSFGNEPLLSQVHKTYENGLVFE